MKKNYKQLIKREGRKMKKTIIILSILFTVILAGVLYGTNQQPDEVEIVTAEQVYDFIPDPMTDFPLY